MTTWHVDAESLRRWVDGLAGPVMGVSVEQHVLHCPTCQAEVARQVPAAPLELVWDSVLAEVEVPRAGRVERLLARCGLTGADALVLCSAMALRLEWLAAVIMVLSFAVVATLLGPDGGVALFLAVAPLVPVAGVAAAYGPTVDTLYELELAAPYAMLRLVLLRTATVLTTSVPVTVVAGLLLPAPRLVAVEWLLPAAGFVAVVLAASIWVEPLVAAGGVAVGWLTIVTVAARLDDPLTVLEPVALIGYLGLALIAGLIIVRRLRGPLTSGLFR
jgi:hypothetical protein